MTFDREHMIRALKNTILSFCHQVIKYENILTLNGDLSIKCDQTESLSLQFDEKLYKSYYAGSCLCTSLIMLENSSTAHGNISDCGLPMIIEQDANQRFAKSLPCCEADVAKRFNLNFIENANIVQDEMVSNRH